MFYSQYKAEELTNNYITMQLNQHKYKMDAIFMNLKTS